MPRLISGRAFQLGMAGIFDSIPVISVVLFAIGIVGVMVYERTRIRQESPDSD